MSDGTCTGMMDISDCRHRFGSFSSSLITILTCHMKDLVIAVILPLYTGCDDLTGRLKPKSSPSQQGNIIH